MRTDYSAVKTAVGVVDDNAIVRAWAGMSLNGSEFRVAGEAASEAGIDGRRVERSRRHGLVNA